MTEQQTLKPCPFCGDRAEIVRVGTARQSSIIACTWCGCSFEANEREHDTGKQWNQRHSEPTLERAKFILNALDAAKNKEVREGMKIFGDKKAAEAGERIAERYGDLRDKLSFDHAATQAKLEFLIEFLSTED